ncbi:NADH-quinone oxidoreductase subunit D [Anaeromyxobacter diazotrophicus]|uniref:NADH-quinone oxidoreductase subunit D n=1 Tax=Anaeromyxobacter diazotrophicus TaxID=2590199 RepID=A0A7I9VNB8_9BACT|nr:NADH-quinone oxidoreductase subunit D [Anaeromyxobacter diazotrophicus]GEJ57892.1 NADH-quinone oxidoreductase subunit D [Anaeromyxobacter diazotrophicus]
MEKLILRRVDHAGEEMLLNFGPQHPSTHGVINFLVDTDGEVMKKAIPDIGYLHRALEKIGESTGYPGFMPYTDRIDYVAAMFANEGYAIAVERLLKVEVPPRAQWLRAIACELCRIASHLVSTGTMASDIGATTPLVHALRERETVNDLIEALCGARLTYNYLRIGGVAFDLPEGWRDRVLKFLDHFDTMLVEWDRLITFNTIYIRRLANVAVIGKEQAIDYGLVGPNLRGSGMDWDVRRDVPYGAYPNFKFEVPIGRGKYGTVGDAFDRYYVRVLEMMESSKIVRQALESLPEGEIVAKVPRKVKPEAGEAFSRVESARGEMAYYVVSDGTEKAYRVRARTGSFTAMGIIEDISPGLMVADLVALIASIDVVAPEIDR